MLRIAEQLERSTREVINLKKHNLAAADDILSVLIQAFDGKRGGAKDIDVVGQIVFLFLASYETTANALTWTFFLLSQHPKIHEDLYHEVDAVLHGAPPAYETLEQFPLMDRIIDESLRLFAPPVYAYRICAQDVVLGPYRIPKGSTVAFSHYMTHHDPELYPEPEKFFPDRWLTIKPSQYEYLPFSRGAHACLGGRFAYTTMRTVLAMVVKRWRLSVARNAKIARRMLITLAPKYGMPMTVHPQDQKFHESKTPVRGDVHEMVSL